MITRKPFKAVTLAALIAASTLAVAHASTITGAGASFPYPVYAKWASDYKAATGNQVNYQSIGSGGGQRQIIAGTVDFGASDDPMSPAELEKHKLVQFPAVIGGAVPVVHIAGVKAGQLRLTGPVLADIFLGKIKMWNDAQITKLNPGLKLPASPIVVIHRADGSGTTFLWTDYLSQVSADWKSKVGAGKAVKWPVGQGGKGNEGVAAYVGQLNNSIGYVEYAYAKQNHLAWTQLQNKAGKFLQPSGDAFAAAASNAKWNSVKGMGVSLANTDGAKSWPITSATFVLLQQTQTKPDQGRAVLNFFDWSWKHGGKAAEKLDYVPLPAAVTTRIRAIWKSDLKAADGKPLVK